MWIFMNSFLKAAVHIGNDHDVNLRQVKNSFWRSTGQLCCAVELINTPMPRSMSFPTQCRVWWEWDPILLSPGRNKFSGIQKPITSANCWIELMENPWSSSGRSSKVHDSGSLWGDSQKRWANYSVIQRISKTGLSSCQCSTTLCNMLKEMKNYVEKIQKELNITLDDFLAVIGLSLDLVQKSGTPHTIANPRDVGIGLRRK